MEILIQFLFIYSLFYLFNYTDLGKIVSDPIRTRFNKAKVQQSKLFEKVVYNSLYPLFCVYCFGFWANLFSTLSLTTALAGAIFSLVIELIIKKLNYAK